MKRLALTLIKAVVALTLMVPSVNAMEAISLREELIKAETTEAVFAIDDYHTFVTGETLNIEKMTAKGATVIKRYGAEDGLKTNAVMIKHANAQPYVYKNQTGEAVAPENGDFTLEESGLELYQRMTTLCREKKGTAAFIIPKTYGIHKRLTEVNAPEAFNYIATAGLEDNGWIMACSARARFMVEKNFQSITKGVETASFFAGRGLEGVTYVKAGEAIKAVEPEKAALSPEEMAASRESMAREVAWLKMNFVKPIGSVKQIGFYNGTYRTTGCDYATVKEVNRTLSKRQYQAKVYDYKVCGSTAVAVGERNVQVVSDGTGAMYANTGNVFVASWVNNR